MTLVTADRVKETATTTGTGSLTLAGAVTGFQAFDAPMNTGDTCYYCIAHQSADEWEVGLGTFTSPSTLARTTVLAGSNGTSAVSLSAGTKDVFVTIPADVTAQRTLLGVLTPSEVLIEEKELTGNAANMSFSSIPQTFRDLRLVIRGRGDIANTRAEVRVQFNGDTGANYDWVGIDGFGTSATSSTGVGVTFIKAGFVAGSTAPAGTSDMTELLVGDYRGTTFHKPVLGLSGMKRAAVSTDLFIEGKSGWWRSTAAITSILAFPESGNFIAGTVGSLYGSL